MDKGVGSPSISIDARFTTSAPTYSTRTRLVRRWLAGMPTGTVGSLGASARSLPSPSMPTIVKLGPGGGLGSAGSGGCGKTRLQVSAAETATPATTNRKRRRASLDVREWEQRRGWRRCEPASAR
jgi:hypothetical protein